VKNIEFDEWMKYAKTLFGPNSELTCSESHHREALGAYTLAELKEATDALYWAKSTTFLMGFKRHGYGLTSLLPTISEFKRVINEKKTIRG